MRKWIVIASLILSLSPAFAVNPSERLADPALEDRARHLSEQLRCLVCQNQNIDSSDAQLAKDLRLLVRERISEGDSDQQVLDFLVARYGDFVLLKPRFEGTGAVLWVLPPRCSCSARLAPGGRCDVAGKWPGLVTWRCRTQKGRHWSGCSKMARMCQETDFMA